MIELTLYTIGLISSESLRKQAPFHCLTGRTEPLAGTFNHALSRAFALNLCLKHICQINHHGVIANGPRAA